MSRTPPSVTSVLLTALLLAGNASVARADGGRGGDESTLNQQGLESRDQARQGYKDLNNAAFVLLFNEDAPAGGFGDHPRAVTWMNASNQNLANWAFGLATKAYEAREKERKKDEQASRPKVRIEAKPGSTGKSEALQVWADTQSAQIRPADPVGYDPLDLAGGDGAPPDTLLNEILDDPISDGPPDAAPILELTPFWAWTAPVLGPEFAGPPDYQPGRDAVLTLLELPKGGLYFADADALDDQPRLPVLGDVPLLGGLFRSERSDERGPFVITVTPRIVRDHDD